LKNNLIKASDASLACAKSSSSPADLQKVLAQALHANAPDDDSPAQYKENDAMTRTSVLMVKTSKST